MPDRLDWSAKLHHKTIWRPNVNTKIKNLFFWAEAKKNNNKTTAPPKGDQHKRCHPQTMPNSITLVVKTLAKKLTVNSRNERLMERLKELERWNGPYGGEDNITL